MLQRIARAREIRRIARGLYDKPQTSSLTGAPTTPDYRQIVDAIARRDQARMLVSGMTAANDLQLTTAVPSRVVAHTDVRLRSIRVGTLVIEFKKTAPSRLYWAGRSAMRVVQALHWMKDVSGDKDSTVTNRLLKVLRAPEHGAAIRADLRAGMPTLPRKSSSSVLPARLAKPDAAAEYVDSPMMTKRLRFGRNVSAEIAGRYGDYRTRLKLTRTLDGDCTCPSDAWPCTHIRALRATWEMNPESLLDVDAFLRGLDARGKADDLGLWD